MIECPTVHVLNLDIKKIPLCDFLGDLNYDVVKYNYYVERVYVTFILQEVYLRALSITIDTVPGVIPIILYVYIASIISGEDYSAFHRGHRMPFAECQLDLTACISASNRNI